MLRATQSTDIPAADLARPKVDDSERTRMLKSVMKSVAKFAASGLGKRKDESAQAAGQLIMKAAEDDEARHVPHQKVRDPEQWGLLNVSQFARFKAVTREDDFYTDLAGGSEFSDLLKENASKIRRHCDSLSYNRPIPEAKIIETAPADGICLVSRFATEDIIAGAAADASEQTRVERAAWSWVHENVKFKELEKVSTRIDDSKRYEDLRRQFPSHHKYHPCLASLTDHSLLDRGLWRAAVQEAMFPTKEPETPKHSPVPKGFAPRTLSKSKSSQGSARRSPAYFSAADRPTKGPSREASMGSGLRGGRQPQQPGKLQSNRSAPVLR